MQTLTLPESSVNQLEQYVWVQQKNLNEIGWNWKCVRSYEIDGANFLLPHFRRHLHGHWSLVSKCVLLLVVRNYFFLSLSSFEISLLDCNKSLSVSTDTNNFHFPSNLMYYNKVSPQTVKQWITSELLIQKCDNLTICQHFAINAFFGVIKAE